MGVLAVTTPTPLRTAMAAAIQNTMLATVVKNPPPCGPRRVSGRHYVEIPWRLEKHVLGVDQRSTVIVRQIQDWLQRDCPGWTGFLAESAENTAELVDLIHRRVALARRHLVVRRIFGGLDVDAVGGAGACA